MKKLVLTCILSFMLFVVGLLYYLLYTNAGLLRIVSVIPAKISYQQLDGDIAHGISLKDFNFKMGSMHLHIKSAELHWQPWDLLHKQLTISSLTGDEVSFTLATSNNKQSTTSTRRPITSFTLIRTLPVNFNISNVNINNITITTGDSPINIKHIDLDAQGKNSHINIKAFNFSSDFANASTSGTINLMKLWETKLNLQAEVNLPDDAKLIATATADHYTHLKIKTTGDITSKLAIDLGNPSVGHAVQITGRVYAETLGVTFSKINAILKQSGNLLTTTASAKLNNKKIKLSGHTDLSKTELPSKFVITGNNIVVMNTPEYYLLASPNLKLSIAGDKIKLNGSIDIPKAKISPKDFSSTVTLPKDTIIKNEGGKKLKKEKSTWQTTMNLLITSKSIKVNYQGLNSLITGRLRILSSPNAPMSAHGQLVIQSGSYQAYGQSLTITKGGTLTFTNSLSDPSLNLKATKSITMDSAGQSDIPTYQRDLIVGIQATGTLSTPVISLFSDPSGLSQQDILSYLVFGLSQSQLSNSQSTVVWQAVNTLNNGGSSIGNIKQQIQDSLGLSELGFSSATEYDPDTQTEETGTTFVVGKRINDRLSLTYSMGLVYPVNILYVRYALSRRWALQTDSSTYGNGADILFSLSRD